METYKPLTEYVISASFLSQVQLKHPTYLYQKNQWTLYNMLKLVEKNSSTTCRCKYDVYDKKYSLNKNW